MATVTADPCPEGGYVAALDNTNAQAAGVPSTVTIPAGETSVTFQVETNPVTSLVPVQIKAVSGGVTRTANLTVRPS